MQLPITSNDIRKTLLGAELTELECNTLAQVCTVRHIPSGEILFREGESHHELYVILDGRLAVNKDSGRGFVDTLHILSAGELAGESAFLDGKPHSATLRAVGDTTVLALHRENLERLIKDHPFMVYHVMRAIIRSIRSIMMRMNSQCVQMSNYIQQSGNRF
jgi:CRP-like cAMP-binding protein